MNAVLVTVLVVIAALAAAAPFAVVAARCFSRGWELAGILVGSAGLMALTVAPAFALRALGLL